LNLAKFNTNNNYSNNNSNISLKRINKSNNYEFQLEEFPKQKKNNVNLNTDNAFEIVNVISDTKKTEF
jgi:hypothetical protein